MRKSIAIFTAAMTLLAGLALGLMIGRNTVQPVTGVTFYAAIDEVNQEYGSLTVTGLEVNSINFRGSFCFNVEDAALEWRGTALTLDELRQGQTVSITFTGDIEETDPAGLNGVVRVELLDDSKE
ncbi:MAG: hypothetical protein LUC87_09780 [Clostridiales bacterium]|nr:hypothetical protein [Clostridiales bacterium]